MNTENITTASYNNAITVSFTNDAWFNATDVAKQFNKKTNEWLRLDSTKEYICALQSFLFPEIAKRENPASVENQLVRTEKGGLNGGGQSWFHPKLAVAFARWLSVDFSIWCDMQIDKILRKSAYGLKDDPINTAPKLNEWQKQYIRECVAEKAYRESRSRQAIYWDLSKEFFVNSYHELHEQEFEAVALWLGFPWLNLTPKTIALTAERFGELCIFEEENKQLRKAINTLMNNQILGKAQNVKAKTYHTDSIQSAIEVILDGIDILDGIEEVSDKIKDAANTVLSGIQLLDNAVATAQPA